jgi:prophage antirepressor-like protein
VTQIQPFTFPITGDSVRTLLVDDSPWFVVPDVCTVLGHSNPSVALAMVDEDDRWTLRRSDALSFAYPFDDLRVQSINLVNESGLYALILRSNVAGAREFKRWVTSEVLPAIRKTGHYGAPAVPTLPEALRNWAAEIEARQEAEGRALAAEHQVRELEPSAHAWDVLASADGDYSAREAANILNRDPAIDTGQNRLLDLLRDWQIIDRRDIPYATHTAHVRLRPRTFTNRATQEEHAAKPQVRLTAQGIRYLHKRLGGTGDVREFIAQGGE